MKFNFPWYVWALIVLSVLAIGYFSSMAKAKFDAKKLAKEEEGETNLHVVKDEATEELAEAA